MNVRGVSTIFRILRVPKNYFPKVEIFRCYIWVFFIYLFFLEFETYDGCILNMYYNG